MCELTASHLEFRKVFEGVANRQQMYALFNRHAQAPLDADRVAGRRYAGEWFEVSECDHDRMFEILPPLFCRGDMFAMREFLAAQITSVFFALTIGGLPRWFHGYCDLSRSASGSSDQLSQDSMRRAILEREGRVGRTMSRREALDHIWSTTGNDFRAYGDEPFAEAFAGRQIVMVFSSTGTKVWKLLDDLTDQEIAAKLPVQLRHRPAATAA